MKKKRKLPTWVLYVIDGCLLVALVFVLGIWRGGWFSKSDAREDSVGDGTFANAVNDIRDNRDGDSLATGDSTDAEGEELQVNIVNSPATGSQNGGLEYCLVDPDTVEFTLTNEMALEKLRNGDIDLYLFPTEDRGVPDITIHLMKHSDQRYEVMTVINDSNFADGALNDNMGVIEYGDDYNRYNEAEFSETGVYFFVRYTGFADKIAECPYFAVADMYSNDYFALGEASNDIIIGADYFDMVPAEFLTSEGDSEFFTPASDKFRIIEIDYEDICLPVVRWWTDKYGIFYWCVADVGERYDEHDDTKVFFILSYENGYVFDVKAKVVYESVDHARRCMALYGDPICPLDITGRNEIDNDLIDSMQSEWIESCEPGFLQMHPEAPEVPEDCRLVHQGRIGDTRYFSYSLSGSYGATGVPLKALPISGQANELKRFGGISDVDVVFRFVEGEFNEETLRIDGESTKTVTYSSF